jgi:hypothetical protein
MAQIDIPDSVKVWKINDGSANVQSWNNYKDNQGYNLYCQSNNKYLTWKKQPLGINLDFIGDAAVRKIHFRLPDGAERDILSGESVAFGIGGGEAFLKYAHRTAGINLEWNQNPAFEWRVFNSNGETGTPIAENTPVAIINDHVEPSADFLVMFDRPSQMADVGWTTSPEFWNGLLNVVDKNKVKIAQAAIALL